MRMLLLLAGCFAGCGTDLEPLYLTEDFYDWQCTEGSGDYPVDKVTVTTTTCDEEVVWIITELHYTTGQFMKQRMYKDELTCEWKNEFPLISAQCDDVDGVTATAWVEPATWSGALFGGSDD